MFECEVLHPKEAPASGEGQNRSLIPMNHDGNRTKGLNYFHPDLLLYFVGGVMYILSVPDVSSYNPMSKSYCISIDARGLSSLEWPPLSFFYKVTLVHVSGNGKIPLFL